MQFDWATLDKHPVKTPMVQRKALTSILHKKSRTSPTPKRQKTVTFALPLPKEECDGDDRADELSEESVARMVWVKYPDQWSRIQTMSDCSITPSARRPMVAPFYPLSVHTAVPAASVPNAASFGPLFA